MNQLALCRIYTAKTNQSCLLPFPIYIYIYRERERERERDLTINQPHPLLNPEAHPHSFTTLMLWHKLLEKDVPP